MNNSAKVALVIFSAILIAVLGYYYVNRESSTPSRITGPREEIAMRNDNLPPGSTPTLPAPPADPSAPGAYAPPGSPSPAVETGGVAPYNGTGPGSTPPAPAGRLGPDTPSSGAGPVAPAPTGPSAHAPVDRTPATQPYGGAATRPSAGTASQPPTFDPRPTQPVQPEQPVRAIRDPAPPPRAPESTGSEYVIKSGDTFASIAKKIYGSDTHWRDIAQANPLVDPSKLKVGKKIRLPDSVNRAGSAPRDGADRTATRTGGAQRSSAAGDSTGGGQIVYLVKPGDTVSSIARQYYHDRSYSQLILKANPKDLKGSASNIKPGMKLVIPPAPQGAR